MDDEFLEMFIAGCDESKMAQLIAIYESVDEQKLAAILETIEDNATR